MGGILILGHAQHGKDTLAGLLNKHYGYTFESSSVAAAKIFLFDKLKEKYGYETFEQCYEDRVNHRAEWYNLIVDYNKDDRARLAKSILEQYDMYVGMRSNEEFQECKKQKLFDLIIGIYDTRKPLELKSSFDIDIWKECDIIIPNCGTLEELENKVCRIETSDQNF